MKILPITYTRGKNSSYNTEKFNFKQNTISYHSTPINRISFTGLELPQNNFEYGYTLEELKDRLSPKKYKKWNLLSPNSPTYINLAEGDKEALQHLIKAAEYLDPVYKRLDNNHNLEFEKFLQLGIQKGDPQAILTKKLYDGQKGIIGKTVNGETTALAKNITAGSGKGFYPDDLSEKEFHQILINMLKKGKTEDVKNILNQRSVVVRDNDELKAIDYTEFFKKEFTKAAQELELAAKSSTNSDFKEYLTLQTKALQENNPMLDCLADKKWATLQSTPLEFTLGRECYEDKMTPTVIKNPRLKELLEKYNIPVYAKDNIGVRVGIVDSEGTEYLLKIKEQLPFMAEKMPFKDKYVQQISTKNNKQTMVDAHIVYMSGHNGAYRGGISIASNLPNNDKLAIQTGGGFRTVYNKELRSAKYADGMEEKLNLILDKSQHKYFNTEALHDFTILHENLHSLGPKIGLENLGVYKNTIEEFKADMGAITMLDELRQKGFYTAQRQKEILTSWIVGYVPMGEDYSSAHRTRNIMQHNYLIKNHAIEFDNYGRMKINFAKVTECGKNLLKEAINIQLKQNEKLAKEFIEQHAHWSDELEMLANKLKSVDTRLNSYLNSPIAKMLKI